MATEKSTKSTEEQAKQQAKAEPKFTVEKLGRIAASFFWRFLLHVRRGDARHDGGIHRRRNESAH